MLRSGVRIVLLEVGKTLSALTSVGSVTVVYNAEMAVFGEFAGEILGALFALKALEVLCITC